jgi:hypothetical protein
MMHDHAPIYLGTILLENNRWNPADRRPTFKVSDWTQRFADDGFDGLELWENHGLLADEDERERLRTGPCPVKVFNSYDVGDPETAGSRKQIAELAVSLGAEGMKYNTGRDAGLHDTYVENLMEWRKLFPPRFRFLCECHRGSTMEDPELASRTLDRLGREDHGIILHGINGEEEQVRERFAHYGDRITHLHCNLSSNGLMTEDALCRRLDLLHDLGFRGSYTIEFTEGVRDGLPIEQLYQHALRDMRLLRSCLSRGRATTEPAR